MNKIKDYFWIYALSIKYYLQGDDWYYANLYAKRLVLGFIKTKDTKKDE